MKPTKDQFVEYVAIRDSGVTNMMNIRYISDISITGLDRNTCLYVMEHFSELAKEYDVAI